jgi:dTDP-L-rhamnose 4-epimerase
MSLHPIDAPQRQTRRALVTGGAGLIGSHIVDLLLREGWSVRILDNLEPQTHRLGRPAWIDDRAQFCIGDIRDRSTVRHALDGIDTVFHQAAYGGYMPEMAKYVHVNSFGTAQMLEVIRDENLPVRKVIVASSQAVYQEGAGMCPTHGLVFPGTRPLAQLQQGDFSVHCPECDAITTSVPTPEQTPIGGETVYAITKVDQERLTLSWGRQTGIPTVALRYSCTYGPRQSIFNPYTGVIAIFATRLLNGQPPILYEDGEQTRDMCFVEDIAQANLLAATTDAFDGLPVNVGSGRPTTVREMARLVGDALGTPIEPVARGEFRPGEMRYLTSDIRLARSAGYEPRADLATGIAQYVSWIKSQGDIHDYFAAAEAGLRARRIVHRLTASTDHAPADGT